MILLEDKLSNRDSPGLEKNHKLKKKKGKKCKKDDLGGKKSSMNKI